MQMTMCVGFKQVQNPKCVRQERKKKILRFWKQNKTKKNYKGGLENEKNNQSNLSVFTLPVIAGAQMAEEWELFFSRWSTPVGVLKAEQHKFTPAGFICMFAVFREYILCSMNNGARGRERGVRNICWRFLQGDSCSLFAETRTQAREARRWFRCTLKAHLISDSFYEPTHPSRLQTRPLKVRGTELGRQQMEDSAETPRFFITVFQQACCPRVVASRTLCLCCNQTCNTVIRFSVIPPGRGNICICTVSRLLRANIMIRLIWKAVAQPRLYRRTLQASATATLQTFEDQMAQCKDPQLCICINLFCTLCSSRQSSKTRQIGIWV